MPLQTFAAIKSELRACFDAGRGVVHRRRDIQSARASLAGAPKCACSMVGGSSPLSMLAALFGNALGLFGAGAYLHEVVKANGWTIGLVSGAVTLFYVDSALLLIPVGSGISHFGPGLIVALAGIALASGVIEVGQATVPWQVYLAFLFMGKLAGPGSQPRPSRQRLRRGSIDIRGARRRSPRSVQAWAGSWAPRRYCSELHRSGLCQRPSSRVFPLSSCCFPLRASCCAIARRIWGFYRTGCDRFAPLHRSIHRIGPAGWPCAPWRSVPSWQLSASA
jgi:hypothetical protein